MKLSASVLAAICIAAVVVPSPVAAALGPNAERRLDETAGAACSVAVTANSTRDTRTQGSAALNLLVHGQNPNMAATLLEREFAAQNMDRSSPQYGAVVNPATPKDPNDTVFAAQAWVPILARYNAGLPDVVLSDLRVHAAAALAYFQAHPVSVSYTNIHLLTASEEVVFSEMFGDANGLRRGTAGMTQWLDAVAKNGIHEFESPTYMTVNMDALYEGALYANQPEERALFSRALDYVWRETTANLFLPKMRLAGAQSRSYDPVRGADEPLSLKLNYAGYDVPIENPARLQCLDIYTILQRDSSYDLPADARALAGRTPRVVEQRWSTDPSATKYTYVTSDYAMGSSNEDYDQTDRVAAIDFAGGPMSQAPIRLIGDDTGYWFGPTPTVQRDGGRVWNHAPTRPSIVQLRNLMLILTDMDAGVPSEGAPLSVGVVFPALSRGIAIDERPVDASRPLLESISSQQVLTVRVGNATAAARIAFAEKATTVDPSIRIEATAPSLAKGVARIAAIQSSDTPQPSRDLRAIILLGADAGAGGATIGPRIRAARIEQSQSGPDWTVTAYVDGHVLSATYDMSAHKSVRRTIDGAPVIVSDPLAVDGRPIVP